MPPITLVELKQENWTKIEGFSSKGRRVKSWYERIKDSAAYLYKEPKIYKSTGFVTQEIWTEFIAYKIGIKLGLNVPEAIPAKDGDTYGILIKSFIERSKTGMPTQELVDAKEILSTFKHPHSHNLKHIKLISQAEMIDENYWTDFRKMLIFDCLIGNNDRHDENWGFIFSQDARKIKISPIYDNASCLASGQNEDSVCELLENENLLSAFIAGKKSRPPNLYLDENNNTKYNHYEIINYLLNTDKDMLSLVADMLQYDYIHYVDDIMTDIQNVDIPKEYKLSDNRKKLILKILSLRKSKLQELINVHI